MQKLNLSNVTLVTVDTVCHELTRLALEDCLRGVNFGAVLTLSDKQILPGWNCWKRFEASNTKDISNAYYKELPRLVKTDFMFIIHWDSWIIHPRMWRPSFLEYDYIGAPWWYVFHNVGNSGFSIRSTAMARYIAHSDLEHAFPDDDVICRRHRPKLEDQGFKFAPTELAGRFAFERSVFYPINEIFGFHGIFNWPQVLDEEGLEKRARLVEASPYVKSRPEYEEFEVKLSKLRYDRMVGAGNGN